MKLINYRNNIVLISGLLISFLMSDFNANAQNKINRLPLQKYSTALNIIKYAYVDSIQEMEVVDKAIISMLKELDPHSSYFSKEEIKEANEPLQGNFDGIGVQFQIYKDTILVVSAIPGGPSDKVGIMAGDKIVMIDDKEATGKKLNNKFVRDHLRGKKGSKVEVAIKRGSRKNLIDFEITRDKIPINSVNAFYMLNENTGYVKLDRFAQKSGKEIKDAIKELKKENMENLILDLRNNSGGYLGAAVEISDIFIDGKKLLVYTEGLRSPYQEFKARSYGAFEEGKLIVLINEGSASASEIVSGAVQDWDRGLILGRRSFGKGLVQRPFQLPDSSVIRLTTARYYTPAGRCIQKSYVGGIDEYYKDFSNRIKKGELTDKAAIVFPDSLKFKTNNNRDVYGGGGIMPDIFIPWDSTRYSDYYTDLIRKGVINEWITSKMEKDRETLSTEYKTISEFKSSFEFTKKELKEFVDFAVEKGVEKNPEEFEASGEYIQLIMKALLARNLFNISGYFEVISVMDVELQAALELINDGKAFDELN